MQRSATSKEVVMRSAMIMLMAVALTGMVVPVLAAEQPVGASEVAIGFAGGAVWTSQTTGVCIWYFPVVRGMELSDLFTDPTKPGRETSRLLWVSDFDALILDAGKPGEAFTRVLIPAGTATIYYSDHPEERVFTGDLKDRSTWGRPIATFTRTASLLQSPDGFASDSFNFSAIPTWTSNFVLGNKSVNFKRVLPQGMTCYESGLKGSSSEAGSCVAIGNPM